MPYQARLGVPITVLHPVRDVNDDPVAGQASAITKSLLKPDRTVDSTTTVTVTDVATGWVQAVFTPSLLGIYTLTLTNPDDPTADGRKVDYEVVVGAGVEASVTLLTSRDRVRTRLQLKNSDGDPITPSDDHVLDDLIDLLISEVSDEYQGRTGRVFAEQQYTEYLDGSGRASLVLGAGPLVSITSLESVAYEDDGAGGVTETLTTIERHTYVLSGLRTQPGFFGLGRLDFVGGNVFTIGAKNYKAVYTAGFDVIPEALVGLATTDVVYRLLTRETVHLVSQLLGDGSISFLRPAQMQEAREVGLSRFVLEAF